MGREEAKLLWDWVEGVGFSLSYCFPEHAQTMYSAHYLCWYTYYNTSVHVCGHPQDLHSCSSTCYRALAVHSLLLATSKTLLTVCSGLRARQNGSLWGWYWYIRIERSSLQFVVDSGQGKMALCGAGTGTLG